MQTNPTRSAVNAELQMWGIYISHEHHQRLSEASTWEKTAFLMMMTTPLPHENFSGRYIITIITTTSTYWCSALTCSVPENCQTLHRFLVAGSFLSVYPWHSIPLPGFSFWQNKLWEKGAKFVGFHIVTFWITFLFFALFALSTFATFQD